MDLLQEYKDLYYKELEQSDRLNSKITMCITFLTILGGIQTLLWTQLKNFSIKWYTVVYISFCVVSLILFIACLLLFLRTYISYSVRQFPIEDIATHNAYIINNANPEQAQSTKEALATKMAERFVRDAIHNREINQTKTKRFNRFIYVTIAALTITFISYAFGIGIDLFEFKQNIENTSQSPIFVQGGETMSEDKLSINNNIKITDRNGDPLEVKLQPSQYRKEVFSIEASKASENKQQP